jgi:hypothetical protein
MLLGRRLRKQGAFCRKHVKHYGRNDLGILRIGNRTELVMTEVDFRSAACKPSAFWQKSFVFH